MHARDWLPSALVSGHTTRTRGERRLSSVRTACELARDPRSRTMTLPAQLPVPSTLAAALAGCLATCGGGTEVDSSRADAAGPGLSSGGNASGGMDARPGGSGGTSIVNHGGSIACSELANYAACASPTLSPRGTAVSALFLLDKSGSMADLAPAYPAGKWSALRQALAAGLSEAQNAMSYGLELFPARTVPSPCSGDACCTVASNPAVDVDVELGTYALPPILTVLDQVVPAGGAPIAAALQAALGYFTTGSGSSLTGTKLVVLVTDGGPNCNGQYPECGVERCTFNIDGTPPCSTTSENCCASTMWGSTGCLDDGPARSAVIALRQAGIRTLVIGIPGSDPYASALAEMADYGGMINPKDAPTYYRVDSAEGLSETLSSIMRSLAHSCALELSSAPSQVYKVVVAVDCEIRRGENSPGAPEWLYEAGPPPTIRILGSSCEELDSGKRVSALYTCGPTL
jgi:hypothetical protein